MSLISQPEGPCDLDIEGLRVGFRIGATSIMAVKDASLRIPAGAAVGLVGESGSGKSTFARAMMGLIGGQPNILESRRADFFGRPVNLAAPAQLEALRGRELAMIFQDPLSYLNPLMRIDRQIIEAIRNSNADEDSKKRLYELLDLVQLPHRAAMSYPHELSGGMRQRVLIAIALACRPKLLLADEPTTALDASTQKEILMLLRRLRHELGMGMLLISHDLVAIGTLCEHVNVMYRGEIIEAGPLGQIFRNPQHEYTKTLLAAAQARKDARGRFITRETELT